MPSDQPTLEESRNARARGSAQAAVEGHHIQPAGVVSYVSRGRVLVIGGEEAQWLAARVQAPLHAEVLLTDGAEEPGVPATPLGGRELAISGHLGAFRIELGSTGHHSHQVLTADLIVDLCDEALIKSELSPPGYWHFGRDPADLDAAAVTLDGMHGTFEKPRYFAYDPNICAHARAGQEGCRRCLESCPADAIISIGEQIEVNPNLCQGGGICAAVCPSGAIRYAYPSAADTLEQARVLLHAYAENGGRDPVLAFFADAEPSRKPTVTSTPESFRLLAWAWPCEP